MKVRQERIVFSFLVAWVFVFVFASGGVGAFVDGFVGGGFGIGWGSDRGTFGAEPVELLKLLVSKL